MKKLLLGLSIVFVLAINVFAQELKVDEQKLLELFKKIDSSTVEIIMIKDGGMGRCTGVVYKNTEKEAIILTAKHCIEPSEEVYVEDTLVVDVGVSVDDDLAYLKTNHLIENKTPAVLAKQNAKRFSFLYMVGYPDGNPFAKIGYVNQTSKDWQFARMKVIGGCSGGGFYNENAELVGVVWGAFSSEDTAIFEPISDVKRFLIEKNLF